MNATKQGKVVVVAAPSGAGKTSLVRALIAQDPEIEVSISHTTRQKRPHETNGSDYYFVSVDHFQQMIDEDEFIEHAQVFGNYYGTSNKEKHRITTAGKHLLLEIDWQGAAQIRTKVPEAISIFILPPSLAALQQRLEQRAQDDEATIKRRMSEAISEISHYADFGFLVVNDDFNLALEHMKDVIASENASFSLEQQSILQKSLLSELLSSAP